MEAVRFTHSNRLRRPLIQVLGATVTLPTALKLVLPAFVLVGLLHLMFGVSADVMLGAMLDANTVSDPVLDSQNRFYGVSFTSYGFLLYLCATDISKYHLVLRILLCVFFAAGCARLCSIATHGVPSIMVLSLLATEIVLPPLCIVWLSRTLIGLDQNALDT